MYRKYSNYEIIYTIENSLVNEIIHLRVILHIKIFWYLLVCIFRSLTPE